MKTRWACRGAAARRRGFTLMEILVVLIIISLILLAAVPSYRRTRAQNDNMAAQAALRTLGSAIRAYSIDHNGVAGHLGYRQPVGNGFILNRIYENERRLQTPCVVGGGESATNELVRLYACGYMKPIPLDLWNSFRNYNFYICEPSASSGCCRNGQSVAYMTSRTVGTGRYNKAGACAWVDVNGDVGNNYDYNTSI